MKFKHKFMKSVPMGRFLAYFLLNAFFGWFVALGKSDSQSVELFKASRIIYDTSPKLVVSGKGFTVEFPDIYLDLSVDGIPLVANTDYIISNMTTCDQPKGFSAITLSLQTGKRWGHVTDGTASMLLSSIKFYNESTINLLNSSAVIATVLPTPSIRANTNVIFQSATNKLVITGTGLIGSNKVKLIFDPPMLPNTFTETSTYPLKTNELTYHLQNNEQWLPSAGNVTGSLVVVGVDTGAGEVQLGNSATSTSSSGTNNQPVGIIVATVQPDPPGTSLLKLKVDQTCVNQVIYQDEQHVYVTGYGFNAETSQNKLNFWNGDQTNFTVVNGSETRLNLLLNDGYWKDMGNLPGDLRLMTVDTGLGFNWDVDPVLRNGISIATLVEVPTVSKSIQIIFQQETSSFRIHGTGFIQFQGKGACDRSRSPYKTQLQFEPPLEEGVDYTLKVEKKKQDKTHHNDIIMTLLQGKSWSENPGLLKVVAINTRGDAGGWREVTDASGKVGVTVAIIIDDYDTWMIGMVSFFVICLIIAACYKQRQKISPVLEKIKNAVRDADKNVKGGSHSYELVPLGGGAESGDEEEGFADSDDVHE